MGRPPQKLPGFTYESWVADGCKPALQLSAGQISKWVKPGLSTVHISTLVNRGDLVRKNSLFDTSDPINAEWFANRIHATKWVGSPNGSKGGSPDDPPPPPRQPAAPGSVTAGDGPAMTALDMDVILDAIERADLTVFRKSDIDKIAKLETAAKTRVERMTKRGMLIDRRLVSTVMGRLYQVDTDQIKPLGMKLSADLGAAFGVEDSASILLIQQTVDEETSKILAHIKRLMNDFLAGVGEPPLDEMEDDPLVGLVERTANMLRGMTLDPAIPLHAKTAMHSRVRELEAAIESAA